MSISNKITAYLLSLSILFLGVFLLNPQTASAVTGGDFNRARIIDDEIFFNSNTMNTGDIQNFLNAKRPTCRAGYTCLKDYHQAFNGIAANAYCGAITGGTKSAANIIFDVSRACGINPQVLIVLLEKEQSLVMDDWPLDIQYRSATGFGCPDTAACDAEYYGYFNQVYNAAKQFKRYVAQPHLFNYAVGRVSHVGYNPNSACGGTSFGMQNAATAALYNYTPYQPNAAALANLYGTGDGCSAYGNRNFWRLFNDWFGPTQYDGYTLAVNSSDNTQWVIFRGVRQYVPSAEIKRAWALPDAAVPMSADYLATIPQGPTLGRLFHLIGDPALYFADNGKKYHVTSAQMRDAWGFTGQTDTYVSYGLWAQPQNAGQLSYSVKNASSPSLYMVDGPNGSNQVVLRQYSSPDVYHAWEGDADNYITLSDDYFSEIDNAVGSSLTITKAVYGANEFQVIAGQRMNQPASIAPLYPGVAQSVSSYTYNRLAQTSSATYLARAVSSPNVYLIDGGVKHHILSPDVLSAWSASGYGVNLLNQSYMNLIPTGSDLNSYLADVGGQLYVMNNNKITVPASLDTAYRSAGSVYSASSTLANLFTTNSAQATGFVRGRNSPQVYMLDNSGKRRHIEYPDKLALWAGSNSTTILNDSIVNTFGTASSPGIFVSDGTNEYVVENGQKVAVDASTKTEWGLSNPQTYSDGTLDRLSSGGSLATALRDGNYYALMRDGSAYVTVDQNIANAWAIDTAATRSRKLVTDLVQQRMLTRFVNSSAFGDNRTFVIDAGNWYSLTDAQRSNIGKSNDPTMSLNSDNAPGNITAWSSVVVKDGSGKHYVIDGGTKRSFANSIIQNHWTGNSALTVPTTTNGFLNLLPNNGTVERAIKGSAPSVFSADTGTKRWIKSPATYNQYYAPFQLVNDSLINALPEGADIP